MKTLVKSTKTKTYINFDGVIYMTNHNYSSFTFEKVNFSTLKEQQLKAIEQVYGWCEIGDFSSINDAYSAYIEISRAEKELIKKENENFLENLRKERNEAWMKLEKMDIIPATVENIRVVLLHLNEQNWGSWSLPKLSIGYSANQHDCDDVTATTITLDSPISHDEYGIENETKFKVGGKHGYLTKYRGL